MPLAKRRLVATVFLVGSLGCEATPLDTGGRLTVWLEVVSAADVPRRINSAAAHNLAVNVAVIEGEHDRAFLQLVCRTAEEQEVPLRLWPLVTKAKGYWASQANHTAFKEHVLRVVGWANEDCPRVREVVFDLAMPVRRLERLRELLSSGAPNLDILVFVKEEMDEQLFEVARLAFRGLVEDLGADGWSVSASTIPLIADDFADRDETIATVLLTPVLGIPWSQVSIHVHRSSYDSFFASTSTKGEELTSGLVTSYAESMVDQFGDAAAIGLGTTGPGVIAEEGLASADELTSDVAAALAAGISIDRISIYSLEGLDDDDDVAEWLRIPQPQKTEVDELTIEARSLFGELDASLD